MEEEDRVEPEEGGNDDGVAREVSLHDVRSTLRRRCEAHAAHSGLAPRMHEDEGHEDGREQDLRDGRRGEPDGGDDHDSPE